MINLQIIVLAVICSTCLSVRGQALCSTSKSTLLNGKTIIYTHYFCCRNFEKKNGTCIECQQGYTTSKGEPCKGCTANKFGTKCAHTCHCTEEERCDNRHGCVPLHPQVSTDRLSTLMYDILQTTDPMNSSKKTMNIIYNESHQTSTYDYDNKTYSKGNGSIGFIVGKKMHSSSFVMFPDHADERPGTTSSQKMIGNYRRQLTPLPKSISSKSKLQELGVKNKDRGKDMIMQGVQSDLRSRSETGPRKPEDLKQISEPRCFSRRQKTL